MSDTERLRDIAYAAKAHWGYDRDRVRAWARERGCTRMEWEAEPNALGFYERMGASAIRDSEPTEWGRVLPVMGVSLVE